jgi:threonine/homoserine/homoserine lactone efflux protein
MLTRAMDASLLALTGFAIAMYITPGPNKVMLTSSAASHGLRATIPHMLGINAGFTLMLLIVCGGIGSLLLVWPPLLPLMRWVGAAWMLWLAWKIATAPPPGEGGGGRVLGFTGAMAFQWINPKAWLITIPAGTTYARPDLPLWLQLLRIGVVFSAVGIPCMLPWMALGRGAARLLHSPARLRVFNIAMALLLVASLIPVLAGD